jgi:integrase
MVGFPYHVRTETPAVSHNLHLTSVRKALAPRREPYWAAPIARGKYIGLRKIDAERASWIARRRDDAGQQAYHSLGYVSDAFDFDAAKVAAEAWFKTKDAGIRTDVVTVADACREYVVDRKREKGPATARDAEARFERTVYDSDFGRIALAKLRTPHLKAWRDGLALSKASANRTLTALKAALNLAVTHRQVSPAAAQEWRDVKPYKDASKRRDLYLDLRQRKALLSKAPGAIRDLIEAALLTGARAGELVSATRGQFDERTGSMTFRGKTGTRTVPLSPAAVSLFKRLSRGKLPAARLLVRDDGKPWAHSDWDELVRAAAAAAKLPKGTCLYTLRHSFITAAITGGMTTLDVARLVGTSVMMIEKHYGHLVASAARERLARLVLA